MIMSKTAGQLGLATLCGSLLIQMIAGCTAFRGNSKTVSDVSPVSYRMVAEPGPGAAKMVYDAYLFPSIRMSKSGSPIEKMSPLQGAGGGIEGWKAASARSSAMSRRVEESFRRAGHDLISFPQLLARSQPYSVVVVSTFYTDPSPIKNPVEGGPDHTVTVKIKGVLFGLDLDPAQSQSVGTVLCTGFYSAEKDDVKEVAGKLLVQAARSLGDQFESFGML